MNTSENQLITPKTLDEFETWEPNDGFKYEWNDGEIIKFGGKNSRHLKLIALLSRHFIKTEAFLAGGNLIARQDVVLTDIQLQRPDLAYFSNAQIESLVGTAEPIPEFIIEVISPNDQILPVKAKIKEYFKHGVKVVWLIYPDVKLVEVYASFKDITVCTDRDICSAKPVLTDFDIAAADLFNY